MGQVEATRSNESIGATQVSPFDDSRKSEQVTRSHDAYLISRPDDKPAISNIGQESVIHEVVFARAAVLRSAVSAERTWHFQDSKIRNIASIFPIADHTAYLR
jgi:hypothetical protein